MDTTNGTSLHLMSFQPVGDLTVTARVYLWPTRAVSCLGRVTGKTRGSLDHKWSAIACRLEDLQAFGPFSHVLGRLPRPDGSPHPMAIALGRPDPGLLAVAFRVLLTWLLDTSPEARADAGVMEALEQAMDDVLDAIAHGTCVEDATFGLASAPSDPALSALSYDALSLAIAERLAGTATPLVDRTGHARELVPAPGRRLMTVPCWPPAGRWRTGADRGTSTSLASLSLTVAVNERPLEPGRRLVDVYPSVSRFLDAPFRNDAYLPHEVSAYLLADSQGDGARIRWLRLPVMRTRSGDFGYDGCASLIYPALSPARPLPPAGDLVRDPASFKDAYVAFSEGLDSANEVYEKDAYMRVCKGVPMPDREALMDSLAKRLEGVFEPVRPLLRQDAWPTGGRGRVRLLNAVPSFPESSLSYRDLGDLDIATWAELDDPYSPPKSDPRSVSRRTKAQAAQRRRIRAALTVDGKAEQASLTILLVADRFSSGREPFTDDCGDLPRLATPEIRRILGPKIDGEPVGGLAVTVRPVCLRGHLYDPDVVNECSSLHPSRLADELAAICGLDPRPKLPGLTVAIVMCPGQKWYETKRDFRYDPKEPIRAAFALLGVLTQFVEPRKAKVGPGGKEGAAGTVSDLATRVCSAVHDILLHAGAYDRPPSNGKAGQHGSPVPGRFAFVSLFRPPRPRHAQPRGGRRGSMPTFPVAMLMDFEAGTRVVVTPAFGPSGTRADACEPMTYPDYLVNIARLQVRCRYGGGEPMGAKQRGDGRHRLMLATLDACMRAIPADGRHTTLLFRGVGLGSYANFLNNIGSSGSSAADAVSEFRDSGRLLLGNDEGIPIAFVADDPMRPVDVCRIRTGKDAEFVPTYYKDRRTLDDGTFRYGEYSGVYLLPEWGVAYVCNSTGKNDPTYKSYALYDDSSLANGGAWRNSRVRALTEVLPYLRDPSTQDPAVWSAQALDVAVQVARTQGGSFGAYRDPLATPIGLLLLDEAKKYAMPTQTFRRNGETGTQSRP